MASASAAINDCALPRRVSGFEIGTLNARRACDYPESPGLRILILNIFK